MENTKYAFIISIILKLHLEYQRDCRNNLSVNLTTKIKIASIKFIIKTNSLPRKDSDQTNRPCSVEDSNDLRLHFVFNYYHKTHHLIERQLHVDSYS